MVDSRRPAKRRRRLAAIPTTSRFGRNWNATILFSHKYSIGSASKSLDVKLGTEPKPKSKPPAKTKQIASPSSNDDRQEETSMEMGQLNLGFFHPKPEDQGKDMEHSEHVPEGEDELETDGNEEVDHISNLCDAIIHHVMSFLPVREAAKMSVLSKRWRKLWASTPIIDFDQKFFLGNGRGDSRKHLNSKLVNFMGEAILFRERAPINLLRVSLHYRSLFHYPIRQWIQISMLYNVQEIHLDFTSGHFFLQRRDEYSSDSLSAYSCYGAYYRSRNYDSASDSMTEEADSMSDTSGNSFSDDESEPPWFIMDPNLFTYGALRVLQLTRCNLRHEGPVAFEKLTCLVLREVRVSEELLHKMLSGCSSLEKLELIKLVEVKHLKFSAPKLLSMSLECCHVLKDVEIDAQILRHFKFRLNYTIEVLSLRFPALSRAQIGLCYDMNRRNINQRADRLVMLLKALSHVTDLTLYSENFKDMVIPKSQMESFSMPNVRRIEMIGKIGDSSISSVFRFLEVFYNLESLCLSIVHRNQEKAQQSGVEEMKLRELDDASISWLRSHLKELKVHGFEGRDIELQLLNFLLDNGKVLEKVDIRTYTPSFLTHGQINARLLSWRRSEDVELRYS